MINYKYNRLENMTVVEMEKFTVFSEDQFPMLVQFKEVVTGKVAWSSPITPGSWVSWSGGEVQHEVVIVDCSGEPVYAKKFDVETQGDLIEKSLYYFLRKLGEKKRPRGLVIGPHDGTFGHWVFPIKDGLSDVVFVDGSEKQLEVLKENYKDVANSKFINEIVTPDGAEVEWFVGGEGFTDTVDKRVIAEFVKEEDIVQTHRTSVAINDLIEREGADFDWIHLDVEGIDADLIMAMNHKPKVIIFEAMHMDQQQFAGVLDWFQDNNYRLYNDFSNAIAIKKD